MESRTLGRNNRTCLISHSYRVSHNAAAGLWMGTLKMPQRAGSVSAVRAAWKAEAETRAWVNTQEAYLHAEDAPESKANTLTQFPWIVSEAFFCVRCQNNSMSLSLFILLPGFLSLRLCRGALRQRAWPEKCMETASREAR